MKRTMLLSVLCLGGLTVFSQSSEPVTEERSSEWLTVEVASASVPAARSTPARSRSTTAVAAPAPAGPANTPSRSIRPMGPSTTPAKPATTTESFKNTNSRVNRFGKKKG